jgi:hypothetical protein
VEDDFGAAVEFALAVPDNANAALATVLDAANHPQQLAALADRLNAAGEAYASSLPAVLRAWAERDAEAALDWLLASRTMLNAVLITDAANALAQRDFASAVQAVNRVPVAFRADWIEEIVRHYDGSSPDAAMAWLARFAEEPGYSEWADSVVGRAAEADPQAAVRLLAAHGSTPALTRAVSAAWAKRAPLQAMQWALGQPAGDTRTSAYAGAAEVWADRDRAGFVEWLLRQPRDDTRDLGLAYVNSATLRQGSVNVRVLDAFSSAAARAAEVVRVAPALARTDVEGARALVRRHVQDAAARAEAERRIQDTL